MVRGRIQRKTWCMGPYARDDYNLTLRVCPLRSRLQHIYHGQPYTRVDLNPMPESTLFPSKGLWIWPQNKGASSLDPQGVLRQMMHRGEILKMRSKLMKW
jgi:hypothetical protein